MVLGAVFAAALGGCDDGESIAPPPCEDCAGGGGSGGDGGGGSGGGVPPGCERSVPSTGCTGMAGVHETVMVDVAGAMRSYDVDVPSAVDCTTPLGILVFFHGLGHDANIYPELDALVDGAHLILVRPVGVPQSWAGGYIGWTPERFDESVQLVRTILDTLEAQYLVDPYRVYAAGVSQGGFMTSGVSAPTALGTVFAGFGIFAAGADPDVCPAATCYLEQPCKVPFFVRIGDQDAAQLPFARSLRDALTAQGWTAAQLSYFEFPGGHTLVPGGPTEMIAWLDAAYPKL
jgi:predicted esterase